MVIQTLQVSGKEITFFLCLLEEWCKLYLYRNEDERESNGEYDEQFRDPSNGVQVPVADCGECDDDEPEGVEEVVLFIATPVLNSLQIVDATHAKNCV